MPINLSSRPGRDRARSSSTNEGISTDDAPSASVLRDSIAELDSTAIVAPDQPSSSSPFTATMATRPSHSSATCQNPTVGMSEMRIMPSLEDEARVKHVFQNLLSGIPGFQTLCDTDFGEEFGRVNAVSDLLVQTLKVSPLIMRQPN